MRNRVLAATVSTQVDYFKQLTLFTMDDMNNDQAAPVAPAMDAPAMDAPVMPEAAPEMEMPVAAEPAAEVAPEAAA